MDDVKRARTIKLLVDWAFRYEGSTRSSALIRIGLVFLIWSRWGYELLLYKDLSVNGFVLSAAFFIFSAMMLIGYKTALSTLFMSLVLFHMYYYYGHYLGREPWTHHHTYLLSFMTFLSSLSPAGKSYSLDRWLAVEHAERAGREKPAETGNLFALRLMMIQLCVLYFWAGYDKSYLDWLNGERLEHYFIWFYGGPTYPDVFWFSPLMALLATWVLVLEYTLAFGLFVPALRRWLIPLGVALHVGFYLLLPVYTYSATCILMYLSVINADKIHRITEV